MHSVSEVGVLVLELSERCGRNTEGGVVDDQDLMDEGLVEEPGDGTCLEQQQGELGLQHDTDERELAVEWGLDVGPVLVTKRSLLGDRRRNDHHSPGWCDS